MHQCTKLILFGYDSLHVSDGLSVHHQEFKTTYCNMFLSKRYCCLLGASSWFYYRNIAMHGPLNAKFPI